MVIFSDQTTRPNQHGGGNDTRRATARPAGLRWPSYVTEFESWWEHKISAYEAFLASPMVDIRDPSRLSSEEHRALSSRLDSANMALYRVTGTRTVDHQAILDLGRQFGLSLAERNLCADEDAVSDITVSNDPVRARYVPYTTRPLSWHTDGYYNPYNRSIRAFILHCDSPAYRGGENQLVDHEILFGLLRRDPNIRIESLFVEDAFSIPANVDNETEIRGRVEGPVFHVEDDELLMRFSARQRNIEWKSDANILTAIEAIKYYLNHSSLVLSIRLERGMGVISRNVLHRRDSFVDALGERRHFLRARYHDAIRKHNLTGSRDALAQ